MSEQFIFVLGETLEAPVRWGAFEDGRIRAKGVITGGDGFERVMERAKPEDRFTAILPGEQVAVRMMEVPPKSPAKFRTAALYLLEDELGEAVGDLHVATMLIGEKGAALAVKDSLVTDWVEHFQDNGVDLDQVTADFLCLPDPAADICLLTEEKRCIVAFPEGGFAADAMIARALLARLEQEGEVRSVVAYGRGEGVFDVIGAPADKRGAVDVAQTLALYAEGLKARPNINFRQGKHRKRRSGQAGFEHWRRSALLAAGVGLAFVALTVAEGVRAERTANRYETAAADLHRQSFPDAANIDPRSHARALLARGGGGGGFLSVSSAVAAAADAVDIVALDRIRYDASRDQYIVSIKSNADGGIEAFRQALVAAGVAAEDSGGYRRSGDVWVGDMMVKAR